MEYRLPELKDENILKEFLQEHFDYNEKHVILEQDLLLEDYSKWVSMIHRNANIGEKPWGKTYQYLCFDHSIFIGILNIRYEINNELANIYGHIGYDVLPTKRNKGYATEMLNIAKKICKEKGLNEIIVGCFQKNIASAKVIKKCGGKLFDVNDHYEKGTLSEYYIITL